MSNIFKHYRSRYERTQEEEYSIQEYLDLCKKDKMAYATAPERMLVAIGEPELLDAAAARASLSAAWPETTSGGTAAPWGIFWEGELQRLI